jgi:hypothetical protein
MNTTATSIEIHKPSHAETASRAYQLFQERGGCHGHDREDWLKAESDLLHLASHEMVVPMTGVPEATSKHKATKAPFIKAAKTPRVKRPMAA